MATAQICDNPRSMRSRPSFICPAQTGRPDRWAGAIVIVSTLLACGGEPPRFTFTPTADDCKAHCITRIEASIANRPAVSAVCGEPVELTLEGLEVGAPVTVRVEAFDEMERRRLSDTVAILAPDKDATTDAIVQLRPKTPLDVTSVTPGPELVIYSSTVVTVEGAGFGLDASEPAVWLRPDGSDAETIETAWRRLDVESWSPTSLRVRVPEGVAGNAIAVEACGTSDTYDADGEFQVRPLVVQQITSVTATACADGRLFGAVGHLNEGGAFIGQLHCPSAAKKSLVFRLQRDQALLGTREFRGVPRTIAASPPDDLLVAHGDQFQFCPTHNTQTLLGPCIDIMGLPANGTAVAAGFSDRAAIVIADVAGSRRVYAGSGSDGPAQHVMLDGGRWPIDADRGLLLSGNATRAAIESPHSGRFDVVVRIADCTASRMRVQRVWDEGMSTLTSGDRIAVVCGEEVVVVDKPRRAEIARVDVAMRIDAVELDATGELLWVFGGATGTLIAYDVRSGEPIGRRVIDMRTSGPAVLVRAPGGRRLMLGAPDHEGVFLLEH